MQPSNPDKFTAKAWDAIVEAQEVARRFRQQYLEVEHVMVALIEQQGLADTVLTKATLDPDLIAQELEAFAQRQVRGRASADSNLYLGQSLDRMLDQAEAARQLLQDDIISVEHLLLGFAEDERIGRRLLRGFELDVSHIRAAINQVRGKQIGRASCRERV